MCLSIVVEPVTLLKCLHTYCRECVDKVMDKQDNPMCGINCPVCRNFCPKDEIQANFFINNLVNMHRKVLSKNNSNLIFELIGLFNSLAAMAYQFPCAEAIYFNLMLN